MLNRKKNSRIYRHVCSFLFLSLYLCFSINSLQPETQSSSTPSKVIRSGEIATTLTFRLVETLKNFNAQRNFQKLATLSNLGFQIPVPNASLVDSHSFLEFKFLSGMLGAVGARSPPNF